jgi:hypothetical protein
MPVRRYVLAIVLFWTATTGWLIYREVWSQRSSGEPPPVSIDLPDEVGKTTHWNVFQGNHKIGRTISDVKYNRDDDTYDLRTTFQQFPPSGEPWPFPIKSMDGYYRVTREGELRAIEETITLDFPIVGEVKAKVTATVEDGALTPKWEIFAGRKIESSSPRIEVSKHGSVLNPLQLVNALKGVRAGQHWRMPLFDPLGESVNAKLSVGKQGVRYVDATVRAAPKTIEWNGREEPCLVIDYRGEEFDAHTWIRERDGLVLRQEATLGGHHLVQERNRD